jgi:REP element-mobilizing transposase RayT
MPPSRDHPLAYHITFGTYGTRLHGDARGTVDRSQNNPGDPIIGRDDAWCRLERNLLRFDPVLLERDQRIHAEASIPDVCHRGEWHLHVAAAKPDHVHVLLTADVEGKAVRRWFKAWLGKAMNKRWPRPAGATWWAECGSIKWIWKRDYFDNVFDYITRQRTTPR